MVAQKHLTLEEYSEWAARHHEARYTLCLCILPLYEGNVATIGPLAQSAERRADNAKVVS